ncbi:MAG: RHS repeat-associated core domain-containing protein, partial [Ferruginibacter sp.]|nr:RHS repeat-associated core domain-containing protein [Ferruginibacter sp.]
NPVPGNRYAGDDTSFLAASSSYPYPQPIVQSSLTKGMVTGTKSEVLNTSTYLYTGIYYDDKGRILQTYAVNLTGLVINTNQYNFAGQLLVSFQRTTSNALSQVIRVPTKYDYDDLNRLVDVRKIVYSNLKVNVSEKVLLKNQYDALGQFKTKILAPTSLTDNIGFEAEKYDYNIRGWLLGMNRDYVGDANTPSYFGFDLGYDKSGIIGSYSPQYNGNISGTIWKSRGDTIKRKYDFAYDGVNRLMKADFTQKKGSSWDVSAGVNFSMRMGNGTDPLSAYDANGNIQAMNQMGLQGTTSVTIDSLSYKYLPNSNQLNYVTDAVNSAGTKLGDFQEPVQNRTDNISGNKADYTYDLNGNLTVDNNKAISSITYNYLNLPWIITTAKGTITYTYDAGGTKIRKATIEQASSLNNQIKTTTTTDYMGSLVYESKSDNDPKTVDYANRLQFGGQEEGRIRAVYGNSQTPDSITNFAFDYFLKDHLGNVRMVLTDERQVDHYPTATLEANAVLQEQQFYWIDTSHVVATPSTVPVYPNNNGFNNPNTYGSSTANSQKMYQLNGSTNRTGLSIILKVMTGDSVNIYAKSYYHYSGSASNNPLSAGDLITSFLGSGGTSGNLPSIHGATSAGLNANTTGTFNPLNLFTNRNPVNPTNNVKAGINYIIFDEQYNYVSGGFDAVNTGTKDSVKTHILQNMVMPKNGYIYIYCSNESNINVFFDNLEVQQTRGPILEETHYYPFGLRMEGICSKAANKTGNKFQHIGKELQSKEFSDGSGLEQYDFGARIQDPQIGRWTSTDPLADNMPMFSPYAYCFNNPIRYIDPSGLEPDDNESDKVRYERNKKTGEIKTVYVSEKEYNEKTANGTTNMIVGDPSTGQLKYDYTSNCSSSAFSTPNFHGNGNYSDETGESFNYSGAHFEKPETGGSENSTNLDKQLESINSGIMAFGIGWGAKQEIFDFAVRDRAGLSRTAFNDLNKVGREAAELVTLGSTGVKYLKGVKAIGAAGAIVAAGISMYRAGNYYANGGQKSSVGIKATIDVVMGAVGFLGPIGFAVSSIYFLTDAVTNGFGGYGKPE